MISESDVDLVTERCRDLPPATGNYLETDFVTNILATVVDYMTHTTAVVKALEHYKGIRFDEVRTMDDLEDVFARFPNDRDGNTALAQFLWGYNMWTRAGQLRDLTAYFRSIGVTTQQQLQQWATSSEFRRDFEGRVKGLGIAVYQWLIMRQGVDTVKPDVHLHRFAETTLSRKLSDDEVIDVFTGAAEILGVKAYELDWRVWESQRSIG